MPPSGSRSAISPGDNSPRRPPSRLRAAVGGDLADQLGEALVVVLPEGDLAAGAGPSLQQLLDQAQLIGASELRGVVDKLVQERARHLLGGNLAALPEVDQAGAHAAHGRAD